MTFSFLLSIAAAVFIQTPTASPAPPSVIPALDRPADALVAADGTGQYTSLQEAISKAPMRTGLGDPRWVIFVKNGVYKERIYVQRGTRQHPGAR